MIPDRSELIFAVVLSCAAIARGQCAPAWSDGRTGGANGTIRALRSLDSSSAVSRGLYAGGSFSSVGPIAAANVAAWGGHSWMPLGAGVNAEVRAMAMHDPDGDGPATPMLIAGGVFTSAGFVPASRVAAWDGVAWSSLGAGVNGHVAALASFDADGAGPGAPVLVAGGGFTTAGGQPAKFVAAWNGFAWSAVGDANNEVVTLASVDPDGSEPAATALFAGGWFNSIGGVFANRVARWDPGAPGWSPLGDGLSGLFPNIAQCFAVFDNDQAGPGFSTLFVGGFYVNAGAVTALGLAQWDGAIWSGVAGGIGFPAEARAAVALDDDGDGPGGQRLFVVGNYVPAVGGPASNIAAWDGAAWASLGAGLDIGAWAVAVFDDDGDGPDPAALYVGGEFSLADGLPVSRLARWGCPRITPPPCADANGDGAVNFADITAVLALFGVDYSPGTGAGDANHDGVVTFADVTAVLSAWGMGCS